MNGPRLRIILAAGVAAVSALIASAAAAQAIDFRVHDPVMIKQGDVYYVFYTGGGVPIATSTDMQNWERAGTVFETAPAWTADALPPRRRGRRGAGAAQAGRRDRRGGRGRGGGGQGAGQGGANVAEEDVDRPDLADDQTADQGGGNRTGGGGRGPGVGGRRSSLWAPDIAFHDGTYYLYYALSSFGSNNSAIGVATNKTLNPGDAEYEWVDHGPVVQSVAGRDLWNAIDPNLAFDGNGTPWLAFGSYWSGIKLVQLKDNLTEVAIPEQWYSLAARDRYWKLEETDAGDTLSSAIEAPFIFKKGDDYYLFVSWDRCCQGANSTYKIVVGRSKTINGPYLDKEGEDMRFGGGSLVVGGNDDWPGVGHSATYTFDGKDYLIFHGYNANANGRSQLWIKEIDWSADGWPTVTLD